MTLANLTRRELQVLKMIGDGYSAATIAELLWKVIQDSLQAMASGVPLGEA